MNFLPEHIAAYSEQHTSPEPELLKQLDRETYQKVLFPRMLSGHLQGRFLSLLSHLVKPRRILEIGTYTGYSALCLAEGLASDGQLHTIDINEELAPMINRYIGEAGMTGRIIPHTGDARTIIPAIEGLFELVFLDADKENYNVYYDLVIDRVAPGGLIIADNVLWSGKVLEQVKPGDKETATLVAFNRKVQDDPRVENVLLPLRDGLMLMRKI